MPTNRVVTALRSGATPWMAPTARISIRSSTYSWASTPTSTTTSPSPLPTSSTTGAASDAVLRNGRHTDHDAVNLVIAGTVDQVQESVVEPLSPGMGILDRLLGPVDEWAFSNLIANWRDAVWHDAVDLVEAESLDRRRDVSDRIGRRAQRLADLIAF
jgi:hypothetical protein